MHGDTFLVRMEGSMVLKAFCKATLHDPDNANMRVTLDPGYLILLVSMPIFGYKAVPIPRIPRKN
jgi:hypothetical protein